MNNLAIQDEFAFIDRIKPVRTFQTGLLTGIGDDAALFRPVQDMEQVICMDTMVEGVHFTTDTMSPSQVGYKALAVNISDIAAMGGIPTFYLVSIAIPKKWSEADLLSIYDGMAMLANKYKMDLIGGDTVSIADTLTVTVTVLGVVEKDKHLLRSNAKPGDIVFVTGTLGDSAAGLELLLHKGKEFSFSEHEKNLVSKHQYPEPQVEIGRTLSKLERVSLNDISDGLASEANEIAKSSQVVITINEELIPYSESIKEVAKSKSLEYALYGGEDFQLVGTMSPTDWQHVKKVSDQSGLPIKKIGTVSSGEPIVYLYRDGTYYTIDRKGYNHFTK
ncbi:thiamine-phosphate kinase [Fredinandcohnia sp. 179-A 10B2 NHS]|uniref:thiamine-phosphate kinase n=1 Tax=Fredinandcohnia sp. 179-A 10B2 NHS TaxID=3235176 RepID=UPI0039A2A3AC